MTGWLEYPANMPNDDEPLLVAALTTNNLSVVQMAKFHVCDGCKGQWELFEPLGEAVITHFLRIPPLPLIHHSKNSAIN